MNFRIPFVRQSPFGLMSQCFGGPSYPMNHCTDLHVTPWHLIGNPSKWFCRPGVNPLKKTEYFPNFADLPYDNELDLDYWVVKGNMASYRKYWILLAEISDDTAAPYAFLRNKIIARDKAGREFPVCFYPDENSGLFNYTELQKGATLVVFCPEMHGFLDMTVGLRVEQLDGFRVLQMPLDAAIRCSELVHTCSVHRCWQCKSDAQRPLKRCCGCGYVRYCGVECQTADFARHKAECANQNVRKIARLVYFAYGSAGKQQGLSVSHPFNLFSPNNST